MQSIDFIRGNLIRSRVRVLEKIEDMQEHCFVFPTANGGWHTLWILGHLAYVEGLVVQKLMLGQNNMLEPWHDIFDGKKISTNPDDYPSFAEVLQTCRQMRQNSLDILDTLQEHNLDKQSHHVPKGYAKTFGKRRNCLQYVADHWYMHRIVHTPCGTYIVVN